MWVTGRKTAAYDLTKFAGTIKTRETGFFHLVKLLIAVSIIFAIFVLFVK